MKALFDAFPFHYETETGKSHIDLEFCHSDGHRGKYHISFEILPLTKKDFNTLFRDKISHDAAVDLSDYIATYCDFVKRCIKNGVIPDTEKELAKYEKELKRFIVMSECLHSYFSDIPIYGSENSDTENTKKTPKKEVTIMKKVNYFEGITTLEDLRNTYRDLLKKNHPDNGGSEEATKEINAQYKKAFEDLKKGVDLSDKKTAIKWDDAEDAAIREALYKIIHLKNINIEVVGSWIWVDGDTFTGRDVLKTAGYKWSRNRKKWHFAPYEKKYYKGGKMKFDEIRARYGSTEVETENREVLTA